MALITTTEAAERLGVNPSRVRQLILAGDLTAEKMGRDHLIREADVANLHRRPCGRPKAPEKRGKTRRK